VFSTPIPTPILKLAGGVRGEPPGTKKVLEVEVVQKPVFGIDFQFAGVIEKAPALLLAC
jgi:hypothetical protein